MSFHIRVRPTALIIRDEQILMIEYKDEDGTHYNLPGGGAEPGETIIEGVKREVFEETMADVDVGQIAFVYECAPHRQSGDYPNTSHSLNLIFECTLKEGSIPRQPDIIDGIQSDVKWISLKDLDSVILYPNIKQIIKDYVGNSNRIGIEIIEDYKLDRYSRTT